MKPALQNLQKSFLVLFVFALGGMAQGQVTVTSQDFEGAGTWAYTSDVLFFDNGFDADGYFGILDITTTTVYSNPDLTTNILAENDLDDEGDNGTAGFANISFAQTDISSFNNVIVTFDYEVIGYNANDDNVKYEVFYDGVGQGEVFILDGGSPPEDASGTVNVSVPPSVNMVELVLKIRNNGSSGFTGFDNFEIISGANIAPNITNIVQTPAAGNVTPSDAVSVSADVTDSDGIASVTLNWGLASGNLTNSIPMNLGTGNTYTTATNIPAQPDGTTVFYEIVAVDNFTPPASTTSPEQSYTSQAPVPAPNLILSEVADPSDDFQGRFVEVYNNGSTFIDFSVTTVFLAKYANDNTTAQSVQLTGSLSPGDFYVVALDAATFNTLYGFGPDLESNTANGNGDDTYTLYVGGDWNTGGTLFEIYGEIGVDGSSELWEYENSRAVRNDLSNSPSDTWIAAQWTITSAASTDMTPGVGETSTTYIYNGTAWSPADPNGNATASDDVEVNSGTASFTQDIAINNLTIATGASLNVEQVLTVNGNITNNGSLVYVNNATKLGQLAPLQQTSTISGSGNVTVQRYVPKRDDSKGAYRYITSAVNSSGNINANWQEGANTINDNPNPGFGMFITGSSTGTNGFDQTQSGAPSMFTWDTGLQDYVAIPNTNVSNLVPGTAYVAYIWGDRSVDIISSNDPVATTTTLRATGALATGDQTGTASAVAGEFSLFGNPYQAIVDVNEVLENSTNLNDLLYYVWDPNLGTRGAYATVDLNGGTTTPSTSEANQYLQPGQAAFFVTEANGAASILFEETDKAVAKTPTDVFRPQNQATIQLQLFQAAFFNNGGPLSDAVRINFSEGESNTLMPNDFAKLSNRDENLAVVNATEHLIVENREMPVDGDILQLYNDQYRVSNYTFKALVNGLPENTTAFLNDAYLNTQTELINGQATLMDFSVDQSIPASVVSDRFSISFSVNGLSTDENLLSESFVLYPNPAKNGTFFIVASGLSSQQVKVSMFNLLGQRVFQTKKEVGPDGRIKIETDGLTSGMYLVKLSANGKTFTEKLIVQ